MNTKNFMFWKGFTNVKFLIGVIASAILLAGVGGAEAGGTGITGITFGGAKNGTGSISGTATPLKVVVAVPGNQLGGLYDTSYHADSIKISAADTIEYLVDVAGVVGIRAVKQSGSRIVWDSTSSEFGNPANDWDSSAVDTGLKLKPGSNVDTLYIYPLGYRNGSVTISARSKKNKATDGVLATYKVTVSSQRSEIANSGLVSIAGFDRTQDTLTSKDSTGQIRVRWTHPSGGGSSYEVFALDTGDGKGNWWTASEGLEFDTITNAALGGNRHTPLASVGVVENGSTRSVTISGLRKGTGYVVGIRQVYAAVSNQATSDLVTEQRAKWGPTKILKLTLPTDTTVTFLNPSGSGPGANLVSYPTITGRTYTGIAQDIGRATLISAGTDPTQGGLDPWDTLYTFKTTGSRGGETYDSVEQRWSVVRKPIDAGQCTTTVTFKNSRYTWTKTTPFYIGPRSLADAFIAFGGPVTFVYDGDSLRPPTLLVTDNLATVTGERKNLAQGKDWLAAPVGKAITRNDSTGNENAAFYNNKNVGTATDAAGPKVRIEGTGNYSGFASRGFAITRKAIAVNPDLSTVAAYEYNGTRNADTSGVNVVFLTGANFAKSVAAIDEGPFTANTDDSVWTFTATTPSADIVAAGSKVTVQVSLGTGSVAKNYTLAAADGKFEKTVVIAKKSALDSSDFKIAGDTIPGNHLYTGLARGIGAVSFAYTQPANTASITVLYNGDTARPVNIGTYEVRAKVNELPGKVSNYVDGLEYVLGSYEIGAPLSAVVDSSNLEAASVRSKSGFALWVAARSPNGGSLSYRWYKDEVLIPSATGARYTPNIDDVGSTASYFVKIINTVPNVQVPDTIETEPASITVIEAAKSLKDMTVVTIEDSLVYNGTPQIPASIVVEYAGTPLTEGTDYELEYANNTNAGSGFVYIVGLDAYKDTLLANFPIARKKLDRDDFFVNLNRTYNTAPQVLTATVTADPVTSAARERLGAATFTYNGSATAPTNAGKYGVRVTFAQGTNFTASDSAFVLDSLVIAKKAAVSSDFNYSIPVDHAYTGQPQGIGAVTIRGTGAGRLTVLYDYDPELPVSAGTYTVAVEVEGGENYTQGIALLGSYRIASDVLLVSEAKIAVESSGYGPVKQEDVNTVAAATAYIESVIDSLGLPTGVAATVKGGAFVAAIEGTEEAPNGVNGSFAFSVTLVKGTARDSTIGLSLTINATAIVVSVASNDRVIPGGKDEQAVVAPVKVVAGEFTVGPNPVAKAVGKAGFFWQGKAVKNGTLYIFDASGSLVKKVAVADKGVDTARRGIGAWDLTGAKGGPVAEGTYLVKGVLVGKDGAKVKVSTLVGVAK